MAAANAYLGRMTQYITVAPDDRLEPRNGIIKLHGPEGFEGMRRAGRLAAVILDALVPHVLPGVSTQELDDIVHRMTLDAGAVPATLGYRGYTKSSCISINHVVCHGIPSDRTLRDGDIVNIDVTPIVNGWHGDTSRMYLVGDVPIKAKRLVDVPSERVTVGWHKAGPAIGPAHFTTPLDPHPRRRAPGTQPTSGAPAVGDASPSTHRSCRPGAPAPAP